MKSYEYGKSPNPINWKEASEILKSMKPKSKNKLIEKLDQIEAQLKVKNNV